MSCPLNRHFAPAGGASGGLAVLAEQDGQVAPRLGVAGVDREQVTQRPFGRGPVAALLQQDVRQDDPWP